MCLERIHRILMTLMLGIAAALLASGFNLGFAVMGFIAIMLLLWASTNFCPSLWMMTKLGIKPFRF